MGPKHYKAGYWVEQGFFDNLSSFRDLKIRIDAVEDPKDRGDVFEIFVEALLETQPIHQCDDHWVVGDVPLPICEDLKLPNDGTGIDGVYRDRMGNHVPYQVKYRRAEQLTFAEIATFYGVTDPDRDHVLFTNASRLSGRVPKRNGVRHHLADKFHALDAEQLQVIKAWLQRKPVRHNRAVPDPAFQSQALSGINISTLRRPLELTAAFFGISLSSRNIRFSLRSREISLPDPHRPACQVIMPTLLDPLVQGRKAHSQICRNLLPRQSAGQSKANRFPFEFHAIPLSHSLSP
jgi:hypothetical protein